MAMLNNQRVIDQQFIDFTCALFIPLHLSRRAAVLQVQLNVVQGSIG